jgi:hypothetical protein
MGGFAAGLSQGLEQARDRQIQAQQLQLQQDMAKYQQKAMESEDQMRQLNIQTVLKKVAAEEALPGLRQSVMGSTPLGPGVEGPAMPVNIEPGNVANLLEAAVKAGRDPDQFLSYMAMQDTTGKIAQMQAEMQPAKYMNVTQGTDLLQIGGRRPPQGQPQQPTPQPTAQAKPATQPEPAEEPLAGIAHNLNPWTMEPMPGMPLRAEAPAAAPSSMGAEEGLAQQAQQAAPLFEQPQAAPQPAAPTPTPPAAQAAPAQPQLPAGVQLIHRNPPKPEKDTASQHNVNAAEADIVGDFAKLYPEKMQMYQDTKGHMPNLTEIGTFFTASEVSAVYQDRELRANQNRVNVARETGVNAAKTAQARLVTDPVMDDVTQYHRYNSETGLIDQLSDPFTTKGKAAELGYRQIKEGRTDQIERFNALEFDLKQRIHRMKEVADAIVTSSGGASAWSQGAGLNFDGLLRSGQPSSYKDPSTGKTLTVGEAVQVYKGMVDTNREAIARTLNGIKGAGSEQDVKNAGAAFTALSETKSINARKFQEIDDRIEDVKRSVVANLFGGQEAGSSKPKKKQTGAEADDDFLRVLQPDAKSRYLKMSPSQQSRYKRAFNDKINEAVIGAR